MWMSSGTGISKIEIMLFSSVVASAAGTYLRMKDIMRLCANLLWCVPSRWNENAGLVSVGNNSHKRLSAIKRRNVLFDPYLSEAGPSYFVFLSFPRLPHVPNTSPVVTSVFVKIGRQGPVSRNSR